MQKLWLDLETFSEIPIKNGTHVYAEGVEIMLFAWAIDEDPVSVHDLTTDYNLPTRLLTALSDESVLIYAHNSHFDRTMLRHALLHTPQHNGAGAGARSPGVSGGTLRNTRRPARQSEEQRR